MADDEKDGPSYNSASEFEKLQEPSLVVDALLSLSVDEHTPNQTYSIKDGVVDRHDQQRRIRVRIDQGNILWLSVTGAGAWYGVLQWPKEVYTLHEMLTEIIESMERSK